MVSKESRLKNMIRERPSLLSYQNALAELRNGVEDVDKTIKVALLRNFTVEPLMLFLETELLTDNYHPSFYLSDFNSMFAEVLNEDSALFQSDPDIILVLTWLEEISTKIANEYFYLSTEEFSSEIDRIISSLETVITGIRSHNNKPILVNNYPFTSRPIQSAFDRFDGMGHYAAVQQLNAAILSLAHSYEDVYIVDFEGIFSNVGAALALNRRAWYSSKSPLGSGVMPPIARAVAELIRGISGKNKKCLVLDCDNTLWGGVVGEDGIDGIKLGPDYPGNAFVDFHRYVRQLQKRGVFLALCSKNNDADVVEVFEKNPFCPLNLDDFAVRKVNWEDKATNIQSIAKELNIGLDSVVFVDDSEFECNWVRKMLPEVEVINLSKNPVNYVDELHSQQFFSSSRITDEDKNRTSMFLGAKKSRDLLINAGSYEAYLADLNIEIEITVNDKTSIPRISQLSNKTNQFNLTTKRYSEAEILEIIESSEADVLSVKLSDANTVYGLIGVAIVEYYGTDVVIDSFFMSCRALSRGVEKALLAEIFQLSMSKGKLRLIGSFIPTKKNQMVESFYKTNFFQGLECNNNANEVRWYYDIAPEKEILYPDYVKPRNVKNGK